jgi:hypothetical protein
MLKRGLRKAISPNGVPPLSHPPPSQCLPLHPSPHPLQFTTLDDLYGVDKRKQDVYEPGMVQPKHRRARRFEVLW